MSKVCWSTGRAWPSWKSTVDGAPPPAAHPIKSQIINDSSMEWMVSSIKMGGERTDSTADT